MSVKCTKAPARGKMPSKAQAALLRDSANLRWVHIRSPGITKRCADGGWLELQNETGRLVLTPAGREVLKQMEGK